MAPIVRKNRLKAGTQPKARPTEPLWKICADRPRAQIVKINEEAAAHSLHFCKHVIPVLSAFPDIESCKALLKEAEKIINRQTQCNIRIGFLGGTGTGKSSLINALLMEKLLPRSVQSASTAVPVEIAYYEEDDDDSKYRAVIEGVSYIEFERELQEWFELKRLWDISMQNEDEKSDPEILHSINATINKLSCIFPDIKQHEDLARTTVEDLLSNKHVIAMLGATFAIYKSSLEDFAAQIAGYIDASKPNTDDEGSFSVWPLVKVVKLYTKAEILKSGIILVDLPGCHDTSAARSTVTDNYKKHLTMSVVVVPAVRASSDKGAQDLLGQADRRTMELDGLYSSDSLYFVITKVDDLEDYRAYIKDRPELKEHCEEDLDVHKSCDDKLQVISHDIEALRKRQRDSDKDVNKVRKMVLKMKEPIDEILKAISKTGQKRKHIDEISDSDVAEASGTQAQKKELRKIRELQFLLKDAEAASNDTAKELVNLQMRKERLQSTLLYATCRLKKACIQTRTDFHSETIQSDFEQTRDSMGSGRSEKPLSIFGVSASAFFDLSEGHKDDCLGRGFITKSDTGIPSLRDALSSTTWVIRERSARAVNQDVERFRTTLRLRFSDASNEYKMALAEKCVLKSRIDDEFMELEQRLFKLHTDTAQDVYKLIHHDLFVKLDHVATQAASVAKQTIIGWCIVRWNTHKATNRHGGLFRDSHNIVYNWNSDLAGVYLDLMIEAGWIGTIHTKLKNRHEAYEAAVEKLIADFADSLLATAHDIHPSIHEALQLLRTNVLGIIPVIQIEGALAIDSIVEGSKSAHRYIKPEVERSWMLVYRQCGAREGKGVYGRNQKAHRDHALWDGGLAMYQRAGQALQEEIQNACDQLPSKYIRSYKDAVSRTQNDLRILLDRHSAAERANSRGILQSMAKLRILLLLHFEELEKAWSREPEDQTVLPEIEEEEFLGINDSDLDSDDDDSDSDDELDLQELGRQYSKSS